jgi:hypothetical protein
MHYGTHATFKILLNLDSVHDCMFFRMADSFSISIKMTFNQLMLLLLTFKLAH